VDYSIFFLKHIFQLFEFLILSGVVGFRMFELIFLAFEFLQSVLDLCDVFIFAFHLLENGVHSVEFLFVLIFHFLQGFAAVSATWGEHILEVCDLSFIAALHSFEGIDKFLEHINETLGLAWVNSCHFIFLGMFTISHLLFSPQSLDLSA
jgi:hypothetical protein